MPNIQIEYKGLSNEQLEKLIDTLPGIVTEILPNKSPVPLIKRVRVTAIELDETLFFKAGKLSEVPFLKITFYLKSATCCNKEALCKLAETITGFAGREILLDDASVYVIFRAVEDRLSYTPPIGEP